MQRFFNALTSRRTMTVVGVVSIAAVLFSAALWFDLPLLWPIVAVAGLLSLILVVSLAKRIAARRSAAKLGDMLEQQAETGKAALPSGTKQTDLDLLRTRLAEAVRTIKTSKIGQASGGAALYELPWYIVIGNPAAGKSSAVLNSGLQFPFAEKTGAIVQGIGGTRNCDWFFTTEDRKSVV